MVFDLHNDFVTANIVDSKRALSSFSPFVKGIVFAVWATRDRPHVSDLSKYFVDAPFTSLFAVEDLGSVRGDVSDVLKLGPAYVSLTWNGANSYGGGIGVETHLSASGKKVLRLMERYGVTLDMAHLSDKTFMDAINDYDGKVLISHTASRNVFDIPRNVPDCFAKKIAQRGGIIGVACVRDFLCDKTKPCNCFDYARHVAHFAEITGVEHVAIGTDFYGTNNLPDGLNAYSDFDGVRENLLRCGFTNEEMDKILYKNACNFLGVTI